MYVLNDGIAAFFKKFESKILFEVNARIGIVMISRTKAA